MKKLYRIYSRRNKPLPLFSGEDYSPFIVYFLKQKKAPMGALAFYNWIKSTTCSFHSRRRHTWSLSVDGFLLYNLVLHQ
jgi:hypothetical protein